MGSVSPESPDWDETLYAGAAPYYAAGRRPYPPQLGEAIARELGLGGDEPAVDVGCGPAGFTVVLAPHVGCVVGIDPDEGMLAEAEAAVARAGLANVELRLMTAEQLPGDLGPVALVTFAQSFHWVDRRRVPGIVRGMLAPGGSCVVVHASTDRGDESHDALSRPRPPYDAIRALVVRYLGPRTRAGRSVRSEAFTPPHVTETYFRSAGFDGPREVDVPRGELVTRTVDQVVAATFSLSSSTPALFGHRRAEFERELRALLESASDDGCFDERARDLRFEVWTPQSIQ